MEKAETQAVKLRILVVEPWMAGPWTRTVQPEFWTGSSELGWMYGDASGGRGRPAVEPEVQ